MENRNSADMKNELEAKLNSINIFHPIAFKKLYSKKKINISINQNVDHYEEIIAFFDSLKINYKSFSPQIEPNPFHLLEDDIIKDKIIEDSHLTFGLETNFQSLFILLEIMKTFGIEKIFYSNESENIVTIGTHNCNDLRDYNYELFKVMDIEKILQMPFFYTTLDMLCDYHNSGEYYILNEVNRNIGDIMNKYDEANFERKSYDDEDERNSFDALTDGQNGNYDDWKNNGGDFDDLRD
jgi:hypothetical protein